MRLIPLEKRDFLVGAHSRTPLLMINSAAIAFAREGADVTTTYLEDCQGERAVSRLRRMPNSNFRGALMR